MTGDTEVKIEETPFEREERLKKEAEWRKQAEITAQVMEERAKAKVKLGNMTDAQFQEYCRNLFS